MSGSTFQTNPFKLLKILDDCQQGIIQLPEFQRSWVWDEDRIKSLIASVSRSYPIGALMSLETGGDTNFKPRTVEGAPDSAKATSPQSLLLDGQQRVTSLYQVTLRGQVVDTVTAKKKKVKRWFYINMRKALDPGADREEAVVSVPEDKVVRTDFNRVVVLDLSTPEKEYDALMYPVTQVFDWDQWREGYDEYWDGKTNKPDKQLFKDFRKRVLENFKSYDIPVIKLDKSTSREAVCVVFEKVNTGGKALDAFELVTAMYASSGHELRKDWYGDGKQNEGRHIRLAETYRHHDAETGILAGVSNTDFLQVVSLFYTREIRRKAESDGKEGKDLPAVIGNRQSLLRLPLEAYKKYEKLVETGFVKAAKFLHQLHIYRIYDLPYQSQVVALAAVLADIGDNWEHAGCREKLVRWYWNGVFGELYGSSVETRISRDFMEVPAWLAGGSEPSTIGDTIFQANRLKTMRTRLSAAYKGLNVLLMSEGAKDFRSGQAFEHAVFFGENVDIHHIFPQDWCKKQAMKPAVFDSILNKTPLAYSTNRMIGGAAPSVYLSLLENGNKKHPPIPRKSLDELLRSHMINPDHLWDDRFADFMADRQKKLITLIERATGKAVYGNIATEPDEDIDEDNEA